VTSSRLRIALLRLGTLAAGAALGLSALTVHAHAPEPRRAAVSADGRSLAVGLPGFGILVRMQPEQPFSYVCNAVLGSEGSAAAQNMAFGADGLLLVAGAIGLRTLDADGCPVQTENELGTAPVVALATQAGGGPVVYAVAGGNSARLFRSADGGKQWQAAALLPAADAVSAVVVSPADPAQLYLSEGNTLRVSRDGGATLTAYPQTMALTLLRVQSGTPERLWAVARDPTGVGNRGYLLLRADAPEGPFQTLLQVAYFGGLAIDGQGVISVGDELGGTYRSQDDGKTFQRLAPDVPVACLAQSADALWACTPESLQKPALRSMDAAAVYAEAMRFTAVESLVACAPELHVERACSAAWAEWRRDVLGQTGTQTDAAVPAPMVDAGADAASAFAPVEPAPSAAGCAIHHGVAHPASTPSTLAWLAGLGLALCAAGLRRSRAVHHARPTCSK
jgi:hypothetical protein